MSTPPSGGGDALAREAASSVLAEAVDRVAHQLKNPLQAMTVNLEVIRMRAGRGDPSEVEALTDVVDENLRTVDRRIRMLVALARRSPRERATSVDLGDLVREAWAAFRLDEPDDGPGLRLRLPDEEAGGGGIGVRARVGGFLALILAASRVTGAEAGGETPYLEVGADEDAGWIEVGPASAWREGGAREAIAEQGRRAGGEVAGGDDASPIRVRFRRA